MHELLERVRASTGGIVTNRTMETYSELLQTAERFSEELCSCGIEPGCTIVVHGDLNCQIPVLMMASWYLEVKLAMSPLSTPQHVGVLAAAIGASWILSPLSEQVAQGERSGLICEVGGATIELTQMPASHKQVNLDGADVFYCTSGSTGTPKVVGRSWDQILWEAAEYTERIQLASHENLATLVPLMHSYGFGSALVASVYSGATLCVTEQLVSNEIKWFLANVEPEVIIASPFSLQLLLKMPSIRCIRYAPRLCISSGAPLSRELAMQVRNQLKWEVCQQYGSSETGAISVIGSDNTNPETVGRPLKSVEVCIDGQPGRQSGCIWVKSPFAANKYILGDSASSFVVGYFVTKDLGTIGADGSLTIVGRSIPELNIAGRKVELESLRNHVSEFPGVTGVKISAIEGDGSPVRLEIGIVKDSACSPKPQDVVAHIEKLFGPFPMNVAVWNAADAPPGFWAKCST